MRAVITGASGFLGSRIALRLVKAGIDVVCLVRSTSSMHELEGKLTPEEWDLIKVVPCRLEAPETYQDYLDQTTVLYHVAAALNGNTSTLFLNTVIPTRKLIEAALAEKVKRFVLVSSMGIYGPQKLPTGTIITEESPLDTHPHKRDAYTYSKSYQEKVCREAHKEHQLPLVVIRPGVIFGPGRGLISGRVGLKFGSMLIRMGGVQQLPYTYVENCADAVVQAGITPGIEGEVFNIVDDELPQGREIVKVSRRHGHKLRQIIIPRLLIHSMCGWYETYSRWTKGMVPAVLSSHRSKAMWRTFKYSNQKAREKLEWIPKVSVSEALELSAASPEKAEA